MRKAKTRLGAVAVLLFWSGWLLLTGASTATMAIQKQAKEASIAATNCQYCHIEKMPKKGEATHNDRGKWLIAQKDKKKAKEVDGAWLKDYPGDKK